MYNIDELKKQIISLDFSKLQEIENLNANELLKYVTSKIEIIENEIKTIYIDKNKNSSFRKIKDSIKVYKTIKRNQNAL